jgi:uncharacterized damage-inducible protein DinB
MSATEALFLETSARFLTASYLDKIERALALLPDEDIWWRPNEVSNSAGNLLLHLTGSLRYWVASVVGNAPNHRIRDSEFTTQSGATRDELLDALREAVREATDVIANLPPSSLSETRQGFKRPVTVLEALYHGVAHFALHTGQLLQLVKLRTGVDLGFPL